MTSKRCTNTKWRWQLGRKKKDARRLDEYFHHIWDDLSDDDVEALLKAIGFNWDEDLTQQQVSKQTFVDKFAGAEFAYAVQSLCDFLVTQRPTLSFQTAMYFTELIATHLAIPTQTLVCHDAALRSYDIHGLDDSLQFIIHRLAMIEDELSFVFNIVDLVQM